MTSSPRAHTVHLDHIRGHIQGSERCKALLQRTSHHLKLWTSPDSVHLFRSGRSVTNSNTFDNVIATPMWATKRAAINSNLAAVVSSQVELARLNARATQALAAAKAALAETHKALRLYAPVSQAIVHGREAREEKAVREEGRPFRSGGEFRACQPALISRRGCLFSRAPRGAPPTKCGGAPHSRPHSRAASFVPKTPPCRIALLVCQS
jgi:hypothetical protein